MEPINDYNKLSVGSTLVCINDVFVESLQKYAKHFPKKGMRYTVRWIAISANNDIQILLNEVRNDLTIINGLPLELSWDIRRFSKTVNPLVIESALYYAAMNAELHELEDDKNPYHETD